VVIWSSAREANVMGMCQQLLSAEQLTRVVAVWARDRFGLSREDYNSRVQCYKRLTRIWADQAIQDTHPVASDLEAGWHQGNTVLIDDSAEKARSEPYNAIQIPEFQGNSKESPEILPLVHDYLNELAWQEDVSRYIRAQPFEVPTRDS
jgi:hypothetical protein